MAEMIWMRELLLIIFNLPLGIIVGAITERFSRRIHRYARLRNIVIKLCVSYVLVCIIMGRDIMHPCNYDDDDDDDGTREHSISSMDMLLILFTVMRVFIVVSGIVIGTSLQPVGLTGGIATGKSTVSSLLQQSSFSSQSNENVVEVEFVIIDVDKIAHDILLPPEKLTTSSNESVYHRLVDEFGSDILTKEDGRGGQDDNNKIDATTVNPMIDRRKLGDIVFPDRLKRRKLNSITHPKIIKIMLQRILFEGLNLQWSRFFFSKTDNLYNAQKKKKKRVVCVDIPLLFEGGLPMRILFGTIIVVVCNPKLQLERLRTRNQDLTLDQCRQRIASQIPVQDKARKAHFVIHNDGSMKSLKNEVMQVKQQVANVVSAGSSLRGIELPWLVIGIAGMLLLNQCLR